MSKPATRPLPEARREQAVEHFDRRRLAGAVGAEEAEDLARRDGERDAVDGDEVVEALGELVHLDGDLSSPLARALDPRPRSRSRREARRFGDAGEEEVLECGRDRRDGGRRVAGGSELVGQAAPARRTPLDRRRPSGRVT